MTIMLTLLGFPKLQSLFKDWVGSNAAHINCALPFSTVHIWLANITKTCFQCNHFYLFLYRNNMFIYKIFLLTLLLVLKNSHGMPQRECMTIDGPQRNKPCMFPFIFRDRIVKSCITGHKRPRPWCSTTTIYESGNWGYCSDACPRIFGKKYFYKNHKTFSNKSF